MTNETNRHPLLERREAIIDQIEKATLAIKDVNCQMKQITTATIAAIDKMIAAINTITKEKP